MKTKSILRGITTAAALAFTIQASATETIVIKGSDTLGAKMVP